MAILLLGTTYLAIDRPILQRSIRDINFTSNRSKRPAVLEVSAQRAEAVKRALAGGLGKRGQLRIPNSWHDQQNIDQKPVPDWSIDPVDAVDSDTRQK
jgi:hypothetical protein